NSSAKITAGGEISSNLRTRPCTVQPVSSGRPPLIWGLRTASNNQGPLPFGLFSNARLNRASTSRTSPGAKGKLAGVIEAQPQEVAKDMTSTPELPAFLIGNFHEK